MRFIFHNLSDESKLPKDFNPDCGGKLVYKLRGVSLKDYYGNEIVNIEKNPDFDVSYYFGVDHPNYCGMNQKQESEIDAKDTKAKTGKRHKALKGLKGLVFGSLVAASAVLGFADISQDIQHGLNDDYKITLKDLSKNISLVNEIDQDDSIFLPEYDKKNSLMFIKNPDKNGICSIDLFFIKSVFNGKTYPKMSDILIKDDLEDIRNLKDYMDSENVGYDILSSYKTSIDGYIAYESELIEIGLDDFLKNEEAIKRILKLDKTLYQEYINHMINPKNIRGVLDMKIVPYKDFHITSLSEETGKDKIQGKSLKDIEKGYNISMKYLEESKENGSISTEEYEKSVYASRKDMLNEIIRSKHQIKELYIDDVGVMYIEPIVMEYTNISETAEFKEFKSLFLEDMGRKKYFEDLNGEYTPTSKFYKTVSEDPKKLLDDMFTTIKKRMKYDYKKSGAIDNYNDETYNHTKAIEELDRFKENINTYKDGKGVCKDYADITVEAWNILQGFSEKLKKIEVYYAMDSHMEHGWNGISSGDLTTYVDLTWDDSDGIPLNNLNAVNKKHYFTRKNQTVVNHI